ncbi:hypothetical protein CDAR_67621 [Caerostris darwini]|uniref:Uncharacterized protein n=1 Tax=Caerostris darwini TaxID=1538125 RepID=A0AAV4VDF0_9ARAC|nr:hypothetical protein CDAR_67621 [Caerostris darwini]
MDVTLVWPLMYLMESDNLAVWQMGGGSVRPLHRHPGDLRNMWNSREARFPAPSAAIPDESRLLSHLPGLGHPYSKMAMGRVRRAATQMEQVNLN